MKLRHVALAIFISMIWGGNFVAAKSAVAYFPTFFFMTMRLVIVSAVLLPFIKRPQLPFRKLLKISTTLTVLHFGFMFSSLEHGLDSTVAVIVDQLRVPFAVTLSYFLFGDKMEKHGIFGIVIALLGTFVIVGTPNIMGNYAAFWMLVAASAAWAYYNTQVKNLEDLDVLSFIGWVSILGVPQLFIISSILEGDQLHLLTQLPPPSVIGSLIYVSIGATILAHGCWYYLLRTYSVNLVVPYSLLVPVFGMSAGVMLLNEALTWQVIVGGILTIIGVAVVVMKRPKAARGGDTT